VLGLAFINHTPLNATFSSKRALIEAVERISPVSAWLRSVDSHVAGEYGMEEPRRAPLLGTPDGSVKQSGARFGRLI
jgi:hypothetical protein